jgi:hypothetical protein
MDRDEQIELAASIQWEVAKGHLRAVSAALGNMSSVTRDEDDKFKYQLLDEAIDRFVREVEDRELQLP